MNHPGNFIDRTGKKYGRLVAISYRQDPNSEKGFWLCKCDCGNTKEIRSAYLLTTKSCGCLRKETTSQRMKTHGLTNIPEYQIWAAVKRRCQLPTDSAYYKYGARGIRLCDRWQKFENFYADMGPRPSNKHSIERIDYTGNYEPSNCRWATILEQANNKRNNVFLTVEIDGKEVTRTVPDWSRVSGVGYYTIRQRLKKGIDPYKAVFTKASPYKKF